MRHSNVESYRSLCHYGYVSKQNVDPHMSSWVHTTYGPFEMGSRNFKTHFCVGNTIYQYLVCINMLYHLESKPYTAQKHDLRMFSYRSCYPFQSSIHQHRTSRIPCSICQVSPCRRYSSTSRCKARLSGTETGGYLVGIIWIVILATWMTWQAIHVLIYKIHV